MDSENPRDLAIKFIENDFRKHQIEVVRHGILRWYYKYGRDFPWRRESASNYEKFIAEILLQKTRAENIVDIYIKFIEKFPDIKKLANANISEVVDLIRPLGLFRSRGRNLIKTAKIIVKKYKGIIPSEVDKLLELPGVGIYIAHSYLISAYDKKLPVVDANFKRFYSRVFLIPVKKDPRRDPFIWEFAKLVLPDRNVKFFTWGVLDFSALVCKKRSPLCSTCLFKDICDFNSKIKDGEVPF